MQYQNHKNKSSGDRWNFGSNWQKSQQARYKIIQDLNYKQRE